jgi:hypothetical protein
MNRKHTMIECSEQEKENKMYMVEGWNKHPPAGVKYQLDPANQAPLCLVS